MFYILMESSTIMIAVIIFSACVLIGFFGERYLRNQNKLDKIFGDNKDKEKKDAAVTETSNLEEKKDGTPGVVETNNLNQNVRLQDVIGGSQTLEVNALGEPLSPNPFTNASQQSMEQTVSNNVQVNNNNIFGADAFNVNNGVQEQFDPFGESSQVQNQTDPFNQSVQVQTGTEPFLNNAANSNDPMVSRPVPFDGNVQNEDNINNIF